MASNLPYTLQDLQDRINTLVNNDTDTPTANGDDWNVVLNLINQAIGTWETQDIFWDELWTTYTHAEVVANADTTYTLTMTDLHSLGGYVRLVLNGTTEYVPVISPEEHQTYQGDVRAVYLTGNNSAGWVLNLGWTPATGDNTVGATIKLDYYKFATRFDSNSATTDKPEMSDPNFIVWSVAATKSLLESKRNQYSVFNTEALNCMDRMRAMNDIKPNFQSNTTTDVDALAGGVIGE